MSFEPTTFSRPTGVKMSNQGFGIVEYGTDANLLVMFYTRPVEDPAKSRDAGRPIHTDVDHVRIQHPGERFNIIDRPASEEDKRRFHTQWSQYIHNKTQVPDGTPIDLLFPNHPSVAENLKALGVHTVEQCSSLSSSAIDNIGMGAQEYVNKAKKFLESAKNGVSFHKYQEENRKLNQQIKILTNQVNTQKKQIDDLIGKMTGTVNNSLQPAWQPGLDAQSERINAVHPTKLATDVERNRQSDDIDFGDDDMVSEI